MPARWRRSPSARPTAASSTSSGRAPVAARHTVGHMLPDVVFGCLHQVMEGGVPAEGASSLWNPQIYGGADRAGRARRDGSDVPPFSTVIFHCGGTGARPGKDGLDVTAFPSGVRTIPVEATESVAPVIFRRREFREGSGGAGRYRGGLGQVIELGGVDGDADRACCAISSASTIRRAAATAAGSARPAG